MIQTFNIELNTTPEAFRYWHTQLVETRSAYNDCSEFLFDGTVPLSLKPVHDAVYEWLRKKHPSLPAQAVIKVYKDVLSAYRSIKSNRHRMTRAPRKRNLAMRLDKRLYSRIQQDGVVLDADWNASFNIANRSKHPVSNRLPKDGGLRFLTGRALSTARKRCKSPQPKGC